VPYQLGDAPISRFTVLQNPFTHTCLALIFTGEKRAAGIEPAPKAWEASVLPLNYARRSVFKTILNGLYYYALYFIINVIYQTTF
jgi:hypothetical protein